MCIENFCYALLHVPCFLFSRLDDEMLVKVADFGLSRDIYERDYYSSDDRKAKLPVKWMSIESLEKGIYNTKTDVVNMLKIIFKVSSVTALLLNMSSDMGLGMINILNLFSVVIWCRAVGADDERRQSISRSRQLGHYKVLEVWSSNAAALVLPRFIVSLNNHSRHFVKLNLSLPAYHCRQWNSWRIYFVKLNDFAWIIYM